MRAIYRRGALSAAALALVIGSGVAMAERPEQPPGQVGRGDPVPLEVSSDSSSRAQAVGVGVGIGVGVGEGGDARASSDQRQGQLQGQLQGQMQGQLQGQDASVHVDMGESSSYVEGDEAVASSAYAGPSSACVSAYGAQASGWGVSLGGVSTDCRSQMEASFYLKMEQEARRLGDDDEADKFKALAYDAAAEAAPNSLMEFAHHLKEWTLDMAIPVGLLILIL